MDALLVEDAGQVGLQNGYLGSQIHPLRSGGQNSKILDAR